MPSSRRHLDRARIEVLDGGTSMPLRIARGPRRVAASRSSPTSAMAFGLGRNGHERAAQAARQARGAQHHLGNHAERAFGADEQIDEIHVRLQ